MESLFTVFALVGGVLGVLFQACLVYLLAQCVRHDLVGALVRYLDKR